MKEVDMLFSFTRAAHRPPAEEYRLATPMADCPGCWKARARAVFGIRVACRTCGRKHGATWARASWRPRR